MALKGDRVILQDDITWTCKSVAERGVVLVRDTSGSGIALGASAGIADLVANPSGKAVVGLLLNDVVDVDETRYHRNYHKDEMKKGERVRVVKKGRVTTNKVTGTPAYDDVAYLDSSGTLIPTAHATGGLVARPKVGKFASVKDENGFAAVDIDLPVV